MHSWFSAAMSGDVDRLKVLLSENVDVNSKNASGYNATALIYAAENMAIECVELLLSKKADVNVLHEKRNCTVLHDILTTHRYKPESRKCVQMILSETTNVNLQNEFGQTPLHIAAEQRWLQGIEWLTSANADVNLITQMGESVLTSVTKNDKWRNRDDTSPKELLGCIKLLLSVHVDVNHQNSGKNTALHFVSCTGNVEYIEAVLSANADVNLQNSEGYIPIVYAIDYHRNNQDGLAVKALKNDFCFKQAKFIMSKELSNIKKLSSGNFGIAYKAELLIGKTKKGDDITINVVCKVSIGETGEDEWHELKALKNLPRNRYVLNLLGICTDFCADLTSDITESAMIVHFKTGGSLRDHLDRRQRPPTYRRMLEFGIDMSRGLQHVHDSSYKHCDLAARNFLLKEKENDDGSEGPQRIILTDFGLTRPLQYKETKPTLFPWRWASIETLNSNGKTTDIRTDVWMLGVALWELIGLKMLPVHHIRNPKFLLEQITKLNKLPLIFPRYTRNEWKSIIEKCCNVDDKKRPSTTKIIDELETLLSSVKSDGIPCDSPDISNIDVDLKEDDKTKEYADDPEEYTGFVEDEKSEQEDYVELYLEVKPDLTSDTNIETELSSNIELTERITLLEDTVKRLENDNCELEKRLESETKARVDLEKLLESYKSGR